MQIQTQRLLLREFVEDDWQAVLAYQADPLYLRYYAWDVRTEQDARQFVRMFIGWQEELPRTRVQLAICLPGSGELIGNCGIRKPRPNANQAELGYELAPWHWGRGYATEAARAMLAFAFSFPDIHRVTASCLAENRASVRVLEKLGFKVEALQPEREYFKQRSWEVLLFSLENPQAGVPNT